MQFLYILLGGFFTSLLEFFLKFFTRKVALGLTSVALFMSFTAYFIGVLYALILGISVAMPSSMTLAISWFVPSNAPLCLAACFAANTARWIYDLKTKTMQFSLFQV